MGIDSKQIKPDFTVKSDITLHVYGEAQKYLLKKLYSSYTLFLISGFIFIVLAIYSFFRQEAESTELQINTIILAASGVLLILMNLIGNRKIKKSISGAYTNFCKIYGNVYDFLFYEDHVTITNATNTSSYENRILQKIVELNSCILLFIGEGKYSAALMISKNNLSAEEYTHLINILKTVLGEKPYIDKTPQKKAK